jgi:hypothetical protein
MLHTLRKSEMRSKLRSKCLNGRDHLVKQGVDGRIILEGILNRE